MLPPDLQPARMVNRGIRKVLPRSLLGRSLLMILLPLVLLQAVALQIFYGSHLDVCRDGCPVPSSARSAISLELLNRYPDEADRVWILSQAARDFDLDMTIETGAVLPNERSTNILGPMDDDLASALREQIGKPFIADWTSNSQSVLISVGLPDGVLHVSVPRKRLYAGMIYIFVLWIAAWRWCCSSSPRSSCATRCARSGAWPAAAEAFGIGRDIGPIKAGGRHRGSSGRRGLQSDAGARAPLPDAADRNAGRRLPRSAHAADPAASGAGDDAGARGTAQDVAEMTADVEEMERMISGYLAFARGEGTEQAEPVNLSAVLEEVAAGARRSGAEVAVDAPAALTLPCAPTRCVAPSPTWWTMRAATRIASHWRRCRRAMVFVTVDDDGPGIRRSGAKACSGRSRATAAGGTGLGLTIARDIVRAHGGEIVLEDCPLGGLRARIRLPI